MLVASVLCASALSGCASGDSQSGSSAAATSVAAPARSGEPRIVIKDFAFKPAKLQVAPGAKVTVVNRDTTTHTVTAAKKSDFDTGDVAAGKKTTFKAPSKPGTYHYICTVHKFMKGTLVVR